MAKQATTKKKTAPKPKKVEESKAETPVVEKPAPKKAELTPLDYDDFRDKAAELSDLVDRATEERMLSSNFLAVMRKKSIEINKALRRH